jgi:very-short-patch-repair endonuclease
MTGPRDWLDAPAEQRPWMAIYWLLTVADVLYPGEPIPGYESQGGSVALAWPTAQVALCVPGDNPKPLTDAGWRAVRLPVGWDAVFTQLAGLTYALQSAGSAATATNPSSQEQRMIEALLSAGLPDPDRDFKVIDPATGQHRATPDFSWPEVKLALEVDGIHWHLGGHVDRVLEQVKQDPAKAKDLKRQAATRFEKDAAKRRLMSSMGWVVVQCTDTEIDQGKAPAIAEMVADTYDRLAAGLPAAQDDLAQDDTTDLPAADPTSSEAASWLLSDDGAVPDQVRSVSPDPTLEH